MKLAERLRRVHYARSRKVDIFVAGRDELGLSPLLEQAFAQSDLSEDT